jgi:hypothetical protein
MYYFSDTFDDLFGDRIIPVDGDITNPSTLDGLKGLNISTVYNCAAVVKALCCRRRAGKNQCGGGV